MVVHRWWRNLAEAGAVLATMLLVAFGLPALERAVPVDVSAPMHRQLVAAGVTVIPPVGAIIGKQTRSGAGEGSILFLIGSARYVIAVSPYEGDLRAATLRLRTKIQNMRGYQVAAPEGPIRTDAGLAGLGSTFTAPGRNGRYVAFVAPGRAVEVTVTSSEADFQHPLARIDESIASIAVAGDVP